MGCRRVSRSSMFVFESVFPVDQVLEGFVSYVVSCFSVTSRRLFAVSVEKMLHVIGLLPCLFQI